MKDEIWDDPAHLEEMKASVAIKTDFILSAEIMTIALAAIPKGGFWLEAATLIIVGMADHSQALRDLNDHFHRGDSSIPGQVLMTLSLQNLIDIDPQIRLG